MAGEAAHAACAYARMRGTGERMSSEASRHLQVGAHEIRLEEPDLVFVRNRGSISPEDVAALLAEAHRFAATHGPLVWLVDMAETVDLSPETRKYVAHSDLFTLIQAAAIYGASFSQRMMTTLVLNVVKLLKLGPAMPEVRFFATEAEARAWLGARRRGPARPQGER